MGWAQKHKGAVACLLVAVALLIDQALKVWVKTHMALGDRIEITPWCYLNFIENNGMAWGMTFFNKYVLSSFRLVAIVFIAWYLHRVVRQGRRLRYVVFLSMILAGAAGNVIDSLFYGLVFSASTPYTVAAFVPFGTGYGHLLTGKVVDMFWFPLIDTWLPSWLPFFGGTHFTFFDPVCNWADFNVTIGVVCLLVFCRKDLEYHAPEAGKAPAPAGDKEKGKVE